MEQELGGLALISANDFAISFDPLFKNCCFSKIYHNFIQLRFLPEKEATDFEKKTSLR